MFRLVRIGFVLVCLVALFWAGTQVKLGELTLYEHVRAITDSRESQELIKGTKNRVSEVGRLIGDEPDDKEVIPPKGREGVRRAPPTKRASDDVVAGGQPPAESVTDSDRKALKRMLESRK